MATLNDLTDGDLINMYRDQHSELAMRTLVSRHHGRLRSRFIREVHHEADAKDLEQQLWLRVVRDLKNYRDDGRFANFLSMIASNLLKDHWRSSGRRNKVFSTAHTDGFGDDNSKSEGVVERYQDPTPDGEKQAIDNELVQYLVDVLVPALPVEQRAAWLLRHESCLLYTSPSPRDRG